MAVVLCGIDPGKKQPYSFGGSGSEQNPIDRNLDSIGRDLVLLVRILTLVFVILAVVNCIYSNAVAISFSLPFPSPFYYTTVAFRAILGVYSYTIPAALTGTSQLKRLIKVSAVGRLRAFIM